MWVFGGCRDLDTSYHDCATSTLTIDYLWPLELRFRLLSKEQSFVLFFFNRCMGKGVKAHIVCCLPLKCDHLTNRVSILRPVFYWKEKAVPFSVKGLNFLGYFPRYHFILATLISLLSNYTSEGFVHRGKCS